jgi:predicted nucleic acid-binding protein
MVVIDSTNLLLMLRPGTPVALDSSGAPIDRPKDGIEYLVKRLSRDKSKIIIPTPALSEALVKAGAAASQQIVEELQRYAAFSIEPFDTRAALEVAAMSRAALADGGKKGRSAAPWQKVKYDRQIVAIAKVHGATEVYSDDSNIEVLCEAAKIKMVRLGELPLPPEDAQFRMDLESASEQFEEGSSAREE